MANNDNVVDISSNKQVFKLYNKKGRVRRILCLIFSILFLLGGSGLVYYYAVLNSLNFVDISKDNNNTGKSGGGQTNATMPSVGELEGSGTHLTIGEGELLQDSKVLNVMLFGEDNKGEDEHGRTDTMIMMSVDNRHKKIKLTSFQRDTYVYIPGHGNNKINAAYTLGGPKLTIETIEANFGIKVDRYAVVDFDSFIEIIDTLGGIDMEVTQDEITYINYQMYKNGQSSEWSTIKEPAGIVHLTGQEALEEGGYHQNHLHRQHHRPDDHHQPQEGRDHRAGFALDDLPRLHGRAVLRSHRGLVVLQRQHRRRLRH